MNQSVINTLNDPQLLDVCSYHVKRLERMFAGDRTDGPFLLSGYGGHGKADPEKEPEKWVEECLENLYEHADLAADRKVFRPLVSEYWFWGVHFTDMVFGAKVRSRSGLWWSPGVENELGELPVPDLETNEFWKTAQRLTLAQVSYGVTLPFFTTQVLGEPWNQFYNIYKDRALTGFYDDPEGMKRDLDIVTDTLVEMHKWFLSVIPAKNYQPICAGGRFQPYGHGQMCGCSTHLISGQLYEEFIRPLDERVASLFPKGVMLHLCGNHVQHIPAWRKMPGICAFQLNDRAIDDLSEFYNRTRPEQLLYLNPSQNMPISKILEITDNGQKSVIIV